MMTDRFGEHDILLTFQEAAALLRVSRATMYRLMSSGQLTGHKVGRGWRFYKLDLHRFVADRHIDQPPVVAPPRAEHVPAGQAAA